MTPEGRALIAQAMRAAWADPARRAARLAAMRAGGQAMAARPEWRQKVAEAVRASWQRPERKAAGRRPKGHGARMAAVTRASWQTPAYRAAQAAARAEDPAEIDRRFAAALAVIRARRRASDS